MIKHGDGGSVHIEGRCLDCRFFDAGWKDDEERPYRKDECDFGECLRFPPVFTGEKKLGAKFLRWEYPEVDSMSWCGEFKPEDNNSDETKGE